MADNRRDAIKFSWLRFWHWGRACCLRIVGKHPDGLYECGSPETVQHVVLGDLCELYKAKREQLFQELSDMGISSSLAGTSKHVNEGLHL